MSQLMSKDLKTRTGAIEKNRFGRYEKPGVPWTSTRVLYRDLRDVEALADRIRERPNRFAAELDPHEADK
jgi:hypothetical protein